MAGWKKKSIALRESRTSCSDDAEKVDLRGGERGSPPRFPGEEFVARDGGWRGWLVCATAFWANGSVVGLHKTFGVLYVELLNVHEQGPMARDVVITAACVGSAAMGILFACAVFTSSVASVVGIRQAASFGVLLACAGLVASSFVTVLEYYFITYSLLVGLGTSFIFTAHMTILMHYFKRNIGMANGIAVLGGSVFSVFQPFIVGFCIRNSGLSTTLQVQAGLMSSVLLCAFMWKEQMPRNTYENGGKRTICNVLAEKCPCANRSIINNRNYILFCIAVALAEFTQFVPFVHMVNHAKETLQSENGELLLMFIAASSGLSRIVLGKVSDMGLISKIRIYQFGALALGIGTTVTPFANNMASLSIICCVIGAAEGAIVVMKIPVLAQFVDVVRASQAVGMIITMSALPQTVGPPMAGWVYNLTGTYRLSFYLAATPSLISACLLFLISSTKGQGPSLIVRHAG